MFYTYEQYRTGFDADGNEAWETERFVIVEARNETDSRLRAEWYGVDFTEMVEGSMTRWILYSDDRDKRVPQIAGSSNLENWRRDGGWVVVYADDNLSSSFVRDLHLEV